MDWETAVIEGIDARQQKDVGQWALGDLALEVETGYGESTLQRYADAVGVSYASLKAYRWVASAYEKVTRVTNLSWSHHRAVATESDRLELLAEASRTGSSVSDLKKLVSSRKAVAAMEQARGEILRLIQEHHTVNASGLPFDRYLMRYWPGFIARTIKGYAGEWPISRANDGTFWGEDIQVRREDLPLAATIVGLWCDGSQAWSQLTGQQVPRPRVITEEGILTLPADQPYRGKRDYSEILPEMLREVAHTFMAPEVAAGRAERFVGEDGEEWYESA